MSEATSDDVPLVLKNAWHWYLDAWHNFGNFEDRSSRAAYWYFALVHLIISLMCLFLDVAFFRWPYPFLTTLYYLASFFPGLSLSVRRLHDRNISGWLILIGVVPILGTLILLYQFAQDSKPGDNRYGAAPKRIDTAPTETNAAVNLDVRAIEIEPSRGWEALDLRGVWEYRELVWFLIWRDIKVRYKQASLGIAWAVIQPVMTMLVFTLIFGRLAQLPSDGLPYPVFTFTALLPWQLFSGALTGSANSVVNSASLISKVYFPRLVIPIASVMATLVDFSISFGVLLGLMAWYGISLRLAVVVLPLLVMLALAIALAVGLWASALNVRYRDVRHVMPFVVQFWLLASPVAYSTSLITSPTWRAVYSLNPMVGVIEGFRWAVLGSTPPSVLMVPSVLVTGVLLAGGLFFFRRTEASFADVI